MRRLWPVLLCASLARADDLAAKLLELWPAPPDWRNHPAVVAFGPVRPPPDDAPIDDLLDYWSLGGGEDEAPSAHVRQRLLEACRAEPRRLGLLWHWLPTTVETVALARSWHARANDHERRMLHGIDELWESDEDRLEHARTKEWGLDALAARDWAAAEPIARELASRRTALGATALGLLAGRAEGDARKGLVKRLRALATDPTADAGGRLRAFNRLRRHEWPGRDKWYRSLFRERHDLPLGWMARDDPERWIPEIARLLGDPDRTVHDHAAHCLAYFHSERARADALRPLLPWLSDPAWATDRDRLRLRVVQSLDRVDLPECEAGVLEILADESQGEYERRAAVAAAAHYRFAAAAPRLRALDAWHAVRRCVALPREEQVAAVVAYAQWRPGRSLTGPEALGAELARHPPDDPEVLAALVRRAVDVPGLSAILHPWPRAEAHVHLVQGIGAGTVDPETLARALTRREEIRNDAASELRALLERGGGPAGVAAAILGDDRPLAGDDAAARRALLACAWLAGVPLDPVKVARHLPDPVAERYLVERGGPGAARHLPGKVLGARPNERFETWMRDLRARDGARELFALRIGTEGAPEWLAVLVHQDRAVLKWFDDPARARVRTLAPGEFDPLLDFIRRHRVEQLPALPPQADDGVWYHYLRLTPDGGRRLYFNNPGLDDQSMVYALFARRFERLLEAAGFVPRYEARDVDVLRRGGVVEVRAGAVRMEGDGWRSLDDGAPVDPPPDARVFGRLRSYGRTDIELGDRRVLRVVANRGVRIDSDGDRRWLVRGGVSHPVLTPDHRWLVFREGDGVTRLDLAEGRVFPSPPRADPVAYVRAHRAVLLEGGILLDPETGRTREVDGEFWPFEDAPHQPTGRPHEVWAAREGVLGRYDTKRFRFVEVRRFPLLPFRTGQMWVAEEAGHVYVAYFDDLLRLPLKKG